MIYFSLFFTFLKISLFAFGGGAATIPLIQHEIVENSHWLTQNEFINLFSLVQVIPGNISVNMALLVGFHKAGFLGGFSALIGFSFLALLVIFLLSHILHKWRHHPYQKALFFGIVPATLACIFYACIMIAKISFMNHSGATHMVEIAILLFCLVAQFLFKFPSLLTLILGTSLGISLL